MRRIVLLWLAGILSIAAFSQKTLSEQARISLLTSAPYDEEVFTVYGHAALRIHDPEQGIDLIFNYGLFDFAKPNFIYRFAKGETDYKLGVANFQDYVIEYQMRGSDITEQTLNLTPAECERIWQALLTNYRPENRVYRYNFFFDNCATRPAAIVERQVAGTIDFRYPYEARTFRALINHCTRNHPWLTFGCDLALGSPTDRLATPHEMMFLPSCLQQAFANASITSPDGTTRPLVSETRIISSEEADFPEQDIWDTLTPLVVGWTIFFMIALLTWGEWKRGSYYYKGIDILLFFLAGMGGVVLFFLGFISVHPCTWPNWSMIWLHPFHLVAVILFCVKKWKRVAYWYHFINFAALTLMLLGWSFVPQHLNTAFLPLVGILWIRSGGGLYRLKWRNG